MEIIILPSLLALDAVLLLIIFLILFCRARKTLDSDIKSNTEKNKLPKKENNSKKTKAGASKKVKPTVKKKTNEKKTGDKKKVVKKK